MKIITVAIILAVVAIDANAAWGGKIWFRRQLYRGTQKWAKILFLWSITKRMRGIQSTKIVNTKSISE